LSCAIAGKAAIAASRPKSVEVVRINKPSLFVGVIPADRYSVS